MPRPSKPKPAAGPDAAPPGADAAGVVQVKVWLLGISPMVWRRLLVTDTLREWFQAEPWRSSGELLERLRAEHPDKFTAGQIRTLQRRVKAWRGEVAHKLVFGDGVSSVDITANPTIAAVPG